MPALRQVWDDIAILAKASIGLAFLGYFLTFGTIVNSTENGITTCTFSDISGLLFGAAGFILAATALKEGRSSDRPILTYLVAVAGLAFGVYNVLHGAGVINNPCN